MTCCGPVVYSVTTFWQRSLRILAHSSWAMVSSSAMFLGLCAAAALFRFHHRFSIGFKSGDCDDHSRIFQPFFPNQAFVDLDVCLGSLPCWNVQWCPSFKFYTGWATFLVRMPWYLSEFMIPSTRWRFPVSLEAKQHNRTMLHGGRVFFSSYALFFLRQIYPDT